MRFNLIPAVLCTLPFASPALAACLAAEEVLITCDITGGARQLSVCVAGEDAVYRYGKAGAAPELELTTPLMDLGYLRGGGPEGTVDEIITFQSGDHSYRIVAGLQNGHQPDPTALQRFGTLTVTRGDKVLADLTCASETVERVPDRLLEQMRRIGRERDSNGATFSNYEIIRPEPAAVSPPCEQDFNVDTCWSRGVGAARNGDLPGALAHYNMSCEAGFNTAGCYEAGKLYLHNRVLRDYKRAEERLIRVCDSGDPGQGPYACKYLGWMALTGTGMPRNLERAWTELLESCLLFNEAQSVDSEGCHFYAQTVLASRNLSPEHDRNAEYMAYLALSVACTDASEGVCAEANTLYTRDAAKDAAWIRDCDLMVQRYGSGETCGDLGRMVEHYDASVARRDMIYSLFLNALNRL